MCKNSESSNNITYFKKPYQKYNNNSKQYRKYNENDLFNKIISTNSPPKKVQETRSYFPSESKVFLKEENYYKSYKNYNKFSNKNRKFSKDSANDSTSNEDNNEIISPNNKESNNNNINNQNSKNQIKPKVLFKSKADDFKIKYKTELCKYFEINGFCKFGDSVRIKLFNF